MTWLLYDMRVRVHVVAGVYVVHVVCCITDKRLLWLLHVVRGGGRGVIRVQLRRAPRSLCRQQNAEARRGCAAG